MQGADANKYRPVSEPEVEQLSNHKAENDPTHGAAKTDEPGE